MRTADLILRVLRPSCGISLSSCTFTLLRYPYLTATRITLLQKKSQPEHDRPPNGKNHKGINVCQACRLCLQGLVNPGIRLGLSFVPSHTGVSQVLSQAVNRIQKIGVVDPNVLHQPCLMELRAPRN